MTKMLKVKEWLKQKREKLLKQKLAIWYNGEEMIEQIEIKIGNKSNKN